MDGEQESIAEAETPIEQEVNEPEAELDIEGDEGQAEPEEDLEEFDWNGKKIKGPKGLKDGVLMHGDYTRKTQEIAATRKELEEHKTQLAQQFQAAEEELTARGRLAMLKGQLEEYSKVNWDQLEAEDPLAANQHWRRFQTMKDQAAAITQDLGNKASQRSQAAQQETAKRFEQTQEWVKQNIKGWTPETDAKVLEWARGKGATNQNLLDAMSPMVYEMIYLAQIGEQALSKKPAAPKPAPITEPLKVVASKSNPPSRKSLSDMSMEEYVAHRRKQGR